MAADVKKAGARLAALIGEPPPRIQNEADLIEYAEHVRTGVQSKALFAEWEIDDLLMELDPEGWWRAQRKAHGRMQKLMNRQAGLKTVHEMNAQRSRRQGEETRAKIARAEAESARLPEHERAGSIAERLRLSPRHVRRVRKSISDK
jgi:hypothetical protein